jgi:polyhydroxyalkanoate synthase subunit PhaC
MRGANPFVGLSPTQTVLAAGRWAGALARHPIVLASEVLRWSAEETKVVAGVSKAAPDPKDKRFKDSAWQNPLWRRLSQSYLVTCESLLRSVDEVGLNAKSADRARFALSQIAEAAAPTNALLGNPAALKKAFRSRGRSLARGSAHIVGDLRHNGGMPSQVDRRPFRVGETIALTPGAVIFRTPMYELIQYTPTTRLVRQRPTVVIPPQINRFYFLDLAPGRSFVEHSVSNGIQTFMIGWRNPGPDQRTWGIDDYSKACIEALEVVRTVTGADQVNVAGFCSGGMTEAAVLSHLARTHNDLIGSATLAVTMLDTQVDSTLNMFASTRSISSATRKSARKGVLDGRSMNRMFAWMRPNDLVWNYWVSNYLMGENPPAFDVMAWNNDPTNMPAKLHADFMEVWLDNGLIRPGGCTVLGNPINLQGVKNDMYVVGALTDHLVPWRSAYGATGAFGGDVRFILSNSGHIQALINPPGNPKASFYSATERPEDPHLWLSQATKTTGSWWSDWADWTLARSGPEVRRPRGFGDRNHPVVEIAPGRYVRE